MKPEELKKQWKLEEDIAYIKGWDFSHIADRHEEEPLPWDYKCIIKKYLKADMKILDYDTGGGEFLLTLNHPYNKTSATEGYKPNILLCENKLKPLRIDFKACDNPSNIPFEDESFDLIINRHGSYDPKEVYRLLKKGGLFITQQVGEDNDRDLVEMVLPNLEKPYPNHNLQIQKKSFEDTGFSIVESNETFKSIKFFDVGAFVWFARIIMWEFPSFSVDFCFDALLKMHEQIKQNGLIAGTIHRFYIVARK